jgi:GntR family transcriptional repressor for pyruvate dehydrogenase complex
MRPVNITRSRLHQQVASHLQQEIIEGRFKPGDRLPPERELCATYGVGRPAIREALLALESAGLIQIANGAPAMVAMPKASTILANVAPAIQQMLSTPEGQHQLQDFRLFMEVGWARYAARNATEAQLQSLKKALEANAAALGDRDEFIRTDVAFHYVFAEIMNNTVFNTLHEAMSGWLYEQRKIALREPYDDTMGYTAHVRIYDAVAARNPDAAEAAMYDHLQVGTTQFWKRYTSS